MGALEFRDLAYLVNFSRTTELDVEPAESKEGRWAIYAGRHRAHTSQYPFHVLYFNSTASLEDIERALQRTVRYRDRDIVYPPSLRRFFLEERHANVRTALKDTKGSWTTREYLVSFIQHEMEAYIRNILDHSPKYYIDPQVQTPSGFVHKIPNPVLAFLQDSISTGWGSLAVVLAEPGQGKTYMSLHLVAQIAKNGGLPLMVDSSQWQSLPIEDQSSLEKTIAHSFRHFGATIGWLDGHEEDFLRVMLKADVFRIVSDGFDEYILRNPSVAPMEVLHNLLNLATTNETRIAITSRTSFWDTSFLDREIDDLVQKSQFLEFRILPFNNDHARNYFNNRFDKGSRRAELAIQTYQNLRRSNEEIAGRGFVLPLVADLAETGDPGVIPNGKGRPLAWLTDALCQRETKRQQLPLTSDEQLEMLRNFAVSISEGELPTTDLLEYCIQLARPELETSLLRPTVEKLRSHPLIGKEGLADSWQFRQSQIEILLLAQQIVDSRDDEIKRFFHRARLGAELLQDLCSMIVDMVRQRSAQEEGAVELVRRIVESARPDVPVQKERSASSNGNSALTGILSLTAVEKLRPKGSGHRERRDLLLQLCGPETINGINFSGIIARFDFRATDFSKCRFERVIWVDCEFDQKTVFRDCHFIGGSAPVHCNGLGSASMVTCRFDPEADALINRVRISEGKKSYAIEDLRADMDSVLTKFMTKGGLGFKTVAATDLTKGRIGESKYREDVIDALKGVVLERHHISGRAGSGYHVTDTAKESVKFYATNNVFTGPLREVFEKLRRRLSLE